MGEPYRLEIPTGIIYAPIQLSASGAVATGIAGRKIVLLSAALGADGAVNIQFQTFTGSANLSGLFYLAMNGGLILPHNPGGWFATLPGDSLLLSLSGSIAVGGSISYAAA